MHTCTWRASPLKLAFVMYEQTAEICMMNLICDGLSDCYDVAGEPQYYSTIFKIEKAWNQDNFQHAGVQIFYFNVVKKSSILTINDSLRMCQGVSQRAIY